MSSNRYLLPIKFARNLVYIIILQCSSIFQIPATDCSNVPPPGKNWLQAFYKHYPELIAIAIKAIDWERHDYYIYNKVVDWFTVIGKELASLLVLAENIYNIGKTGVLPSIPNLLKILVGRNELKRYRGTGIKQTLITAIEYISANGWYLHFLIIWPAAHKSTWTTYPTPG
jgi:hypothetical protein